VVAVGGRRQPSVTELGKKPTMSVIGFWLGLCECCTLFEIDGLHPYRLSGGVAVVAVGVAVGARRQPSVTVMSPLPASLAPRVVNHTPVIQASQPVTSQS
jgi:hypothetical protein